MLNVDAAELERKITKQQQMAFHSTGDTGNTRGPQDQSLVANKMVSDFTDYDEKDKPLFFIHLGDVIYSFGEEQYYYDQFYEPYRNYPAPIIALAGNHDGMAAPGTKVATLAAFLENFCATPPGFHVTPEAGGLSHTAQIQPSVFFTFEAPMLRILALYSNTLEDPGVIADRIIGDSQLTYLRPR
jgi:Calcineurin-like phosphoesterase